MLPPKPVPNYILSIPANATNEQREGWINWAKNYKNIRIVEQFGPLTPDNWNTIRINQLINSLK